jgi:hypothetical protein
MAFTPKRKSKNWRNGNFGSIIRSSPNQKTNDADENHRPHRYPIGGRQSGDPRFHTSRRDGRFAANDAFQKAEASGRHIRTKIVTLKDRLDVGQLVQPAHLAESKWTFRNTLEEAEQIPQICAPTTDLCWPTANSHFSFGVALDGVQFTHRARINVNFDFQNEYFEPSEGGVGREKVVCREFRKTVVLSNRH